MQQFEMWLWILGWGLLLMVAYMALFLRQLSGNLNGSRGWWFKGRL